MNKPDPIANDIPTILKVPLFLTAFPAALEPATAAAIVADMARGNGGGDTTPRA